MRFDLIYMNSDEDSSKTEFLLHGKIIPYDACSSQSHIPVSRIYNSKKFEYIGSSFTLVIDDRISRRDTLHHFYKKRNNY